MKKVRYKVSLCKYSTVIDKVVTHSLAYLSVPKCGERPLGLIRENSAESDQPFSRTLLSILLVAPQP